MDFSTLPPHLRQSYNTDSRRRMIDALSQSASDTSPVQHPLQAIARAFQGYVAGDKGKQLDSDYNQRQANYSAALQKALSGDMSGAAQLGPEIQSVMLAQQLKGKDPLKASDLVPVMGDDGAQIYGTAQDAVGKGVPQKQGSQKYVTLYDPRNPNATPVSAAEGSEQFTQALERGYVIGGDYKTPDAPQSGFAGSGMPAQEANALIKYTQLTQSGQPVPQDLRMMAQWAYEKNSKDRIQTMPDGSTVMIPAMDLSAFADPYGGQQQPVSGQPQPAQAMPQQAAAQPPAQSLPAGASMVSPPKAVIEARDSIPKVRDETANMIQMVDDLVSHPGMSGVVGMPNSLSGTVGMVTGSYPRGSKEADFQARLDQIGGQQFLQAFEGLKGGGQITETEGRKATEAMSRLSMTGQSEGAYRQAAEDLKEVLKRAAARTYEKAGLPVPPEFESRKVRVEQPQAPSVSDFVEPTPDNPLGLKLPQGTPRQGSQF